MRFVLVGATLLGVVALALTGCAADPSPTPSFYTHLSMSAGGDTIVVGEIRNAGYATMRAMIDWQGVLQVQDGAGETVACAIASEFTGSVLPGDSDFPMRWSGPLLPGSYEVIWGAPGHGGIRVDFRVVDSDAGSVLKREETTRIDGGLVLDAQGCTAQGGESVDVGGGVPSP